jgi:hypothetical protein
MLILPGFNLAEVSVKKVWQLPDKASNRDFNGLWLFAANPNFGTKFS